MKQMKKLASLLLALVMTLALSVSALAAGSNTILLKTHRRTRLTRFTRCWTCL